MKPGNTKATGRKGKNKCAMCPKPLNGNQQAYCSRACQEKARRQRKKAEATT